MKPLTCAPTASPWTSPRGLLRDLLVQPEATVGALAQTFDLPKREISNRPTPHRPHGDSPIPKRSETRRAAWATDEAEQLRPKEEHEHYAGHRQPDSPGAEDWFKQVHRHRYAADDVANAQKPVPGLVLSGSEVLTQRHENALCLRTWHGIVEAHVATRNPPAHRRFRRSRGPNCLHSASDCQKRCRS